MRPLDPMEEDGVFHFVLPCVLVVAVLGVYGWGITIWTLLSSAA